MARARKRTVRDDGRVKQKVSYLAQDGSKRVKEIYARTDADLKIRVDSFRAAVGKGLNVSGGADQTVGELLKQWLEIVVAAKSAPNTYIAYEKAILHLTLFVGAIPIGKLNSLHVDRMITAMSREPAPDWTRTGPGGQEVTVPGVRRSVSVVRKAFAVLKTACNKAVTWKLIADNPCNGCTPPPPSDEEMKFYTDVQARHLKEAAARKGPFLECLIRLALWGMREGEIQGLRWCDVDLDRGEIRIRHQGAEVDTKHAHLAKRCKDRKGGCCESMALGPPKSKAGKRTVPLDPATVQALGRLREWLVSERMPALGLGWVFPAVKGQDGANYVGKKNIMRRFRTLTMTADLPRIRFHDLRHTAISLMLARGVLPAVVMQLVGHSRLAQMDKYRHFIPAQGENPAIAAMAGLWA